MSAAELKEKKELIIQEIQQVEDEWILKAIEKLLDINSDENEELDNRMKKRKRRRSMTITYKTMRIYTLS